MHKSFKFGVHLGRKHNHKHNMVLTSDARISIQSFSASEDGLDTLCSSYVCVASDDTALEECPRV